MPFLLIRIVSNIFNKRGSKKGLSKLRTTTRITIITWITTRITIMILISKPFLSLIIVIFSRSFIKFKIF
jgi:hypothetical protein